jgi:hypothetical protein
MRFESNPVTVMALDLASAPIEEREAMANHYAAEIEKLVRAHLPNLSEVELEERQLGVKCAVWQAALDIIEGSSGQVGHA